MTPEVLAFLRDYAKWLDTGAPNGGPFDRNYGLCVNARDRVKDNYITFAEIFEKQGMADIHYPFNSSLWEYEVEKNRSLCHLNPARVAWVRRMIEEHA